VGDVEDKHGYSSSIAQGYGAAAGARGKPPPAALPSPSRPRQRHQEALRPVLGAVARLDERPDGLGELPQLGGGEGDVPQPQVDLDGGEEVGGGHGCLAGVRGWVTRGAAVSARPCPAPPAPVAPSGG